jgi:MFS family permease
MSFTDDLPSVPAAAPALVASDLAPVGRVGARFFVTYGLMYFGLMLAVMMPGFFSLPYKIGLIAPDDRVVVLGGISAIGAVVGLIAGPAAGVLSDRTATRIGRRRPWLFAGILIGALGATVVALAPTVPVLLAGWLVVSVGGAFLIAAISPVLVEQVPESQRGTASAIAGVGTQLAGVVAFSVGGLLTGNIFLLFLAPLVLLALVSVAYVLVVPDPLVILPATRVRDAFRLMVFNPYAHKDFAWLWLGKVLMQLALAFLSTFQLYFVLDRLGFTAEEAGGKLALVGGIGILVTMTFAVVSGTLSDRLRRRKPFILASTGLAAAGMVLLAFTDGYGLFFAGVMCILGGAGMFGSSDVALASELVPEPDHAGRWMSIYHTSATLSAAIAPLLGALVLGIGSSNNTNYTALFLVGAVVALGTAATTLAIKGAR